MSLAEDIQKYWYVSTRPPLGLRVLAGIYAAVTALHRRLVRSGWLRRQRLPVPVVVIGNISVGGTGKTPLVLALITALRARGFTPAVVSRGYGGSERGPLLLDAQPDPARFGDEPCLIRTRSGARVAIGSDRVAAARLLLGQGVDVILSDDGLQHHRLSRDIEICVIDGQRRFGNGRLLPAGPLREPLTRLATVDFRVVNGVDAQPGEIAMHLIAGDAWRLNAADQQRPLSTWRGQRVHAVAGIGHPPRFFASLREVGIDVIEHPFADHHAYRASELSFNDGLPVLMTEKDAVKCADFDLADAWVVPVEAQLPPGFFDQVAAKLRSVPVTPIGVT